jgi:hypothetical membrane protein
MAGTGVVVLAVTCSALRYRGRSGERFSLLNHFISELGERGVSRGAWAFNGGLVLAGLLFLPFAAHLGIVLGSVLGWVGAFFAAAASLGVAAVGIFPMNTLKRHVPAAMIFFYGGLLMALTIGLAILTQPAGRAVVPRVASLLSLLAACAFGSFVALPRIVMPELVRTIQLDPQVLRERPRFWILPFMEWLVFFTTISWLLGMALFLPRQ